MRMKGNWNPHSLRYRHFEKQYSNTSKANGKPSDTAIILLGIYGRNYSSLQYKIVYKC